MDCLRIRSRKIQLTISKEVEDNQTTIIAYHSKKDQASSKKDYTDNNSMILSSINITTHDATSQDGTNTFNKSSMTNIIS